MPLTSKTEPTTATSSSSSASSSSRRRRYREETERRGNLLQQIACLWKAPVGCAEASSPLQRRKNKNNSARYGGVKSQTSTSTFLDEDDDYDDDDDELYDNEDDCALESNDDNHHEAASSTSTTMVQVLPVPDETATRQEWLEYYTHRLPMAMDWTERANLFYATGNLYVQMRQYEAATHAFEQEAAVLTSQGVKGDALVPIYKSLAKLWTVRQPSKALQYYQTALQHCHCPEDRQALKHAMGRLYFQTGNLEQAMQVSIGGTMPK